MAKKSDIATLKEKFKGKIIMGTDIKPQEWLETGIDSFDILAKGFPFGKIIELYGRESSGKSWLSYQLIKKAQSKGLQCVIVDAEKSFDANWVGKLGVDLENVYVYQPIDGEDGVDYITECLKKNLFHLIIIDSIDALSPKKEKEDSAEDAQMAIKARIINKAMRIWNSLLSSTELSPEPLILCINQLRDTMALYGDKETTPGGRGLKYYAGMRIELRKKKLYKDEGYQEVHFSIEKSKVGTPLKEGEFNLFIMDGVQPAGTFNDKERIIELAQLKNIISDGSWIDYDEQKFHGKSEFLEYVESNPDIYKNFIDKVKKAYAGQ